ncbi:TetR family transcriptional regulator [Actinosynnema sp. ALI-1.44]|uniref:TetR/AcrR family transcriptional regulator n=1 Tax=Actinosynnema sp. ALI-1.44 TaxID=1933779 RepID=UPI00097CB8C7|nr:TetR/AcrR family transcriptional regulator [Actinosynnema sp. ALI-1.44]ONI70230.1 TetR family transcriptional regulator [Actinosynnema sp. ALI-1.44]
MNPVPRTGRPPRVNRDAILAATRALIDRDGWENLTMRKLAAEVGVAATTLYHHVRDKEDLLIQLLDYYADEIKRPELPDDPRERIVLTALAMHDALAAWPWITEVLTADDLVGESALWVTEEIMAAAVDSGQTLEEAVYVYRTVWYYTAGEIMIKARGARRRAEGQPNYRDAVLRKQTHRPTVYAVAERWPELSMRDTYEAGLRALVNGLLSA